MSGIRRHEVRGLEGEERREAHYLRTHGVGPDVPVGICLERSFELVIGLLGILKAGGAYVPIDPDYPRDRIEYMLSDSAARLLLTNSTIAKSLPRGAAPLVCLDRDYSETACYPQDDPTSTTGPENLSYVIYTSGSTGKPKGVMNTHRGIVNRLLWMQEQYRLDLHDRVLQKTPISFDVSVWEFFWPLLRGATLVLAKPGGQRDAAYLTEIIRAQKVTTIHFVPSMLRLFLADPAARMCTSLQRVFCSGEALPWELQQLFFSTCSWCELHNLYGPTEAAVDVSYWQCTGDLYKGRVPIGRPIANTQLYILDSEQHPVPIGVPGELYIGGVGVARGYINRPDLTQDRFISDPFIGVSGSPTSRLYRTGDLARFLSDGNIEFIGRIDHQVKVRGYRIEPGEIEAVLLEHDAIEEAVVLAHTTALGHTQLVACLRAGPNCRPSIGELRTFLTARLPEYMVPGRFTFVKRMPLTPNGKIDRKALRDLPCEAPELENPHFAPCTPTEETLALIWGNVLGLSRIGVNNNFFAIGGDSLFAVQVVTQVHELLSADIDVGAMFEHPTIRELAQIIDASPRRQHTEERSAPTPVGVAKRAAVQQNYYWEIWQKKPAEPRNVHTAIRIRGKFNLPVIETCIKELLVRHDALRTTFFEDGGRLYLRVAHTAEVNLRHVNLTNELPDERLTRALAIIQEAARASFDLMCGPLIQFCTILLDRNDLILFVNGHHIILDGRSIQILLEELITLYKARVNGDTEVTLRQTIRFSDYAHQSSIAHDKNVAAYAAAFKNTFQGLQANFLITDVPYAARDAAMNSCKVGRIEADKAQRLKQIALHENVTLFNLLFSAFQILLRRHSVHDRMYVWTIYSGRDKAELNDVIGLFSTYVVQRVEVIPGELYRDVVRHSHAHMLENLYQVNMADTLKLSLLREVADTQNGKQDEVCFSFNSFATVPELSRGIRSIVPSIELLEYENLPPVKDLNMIVTDRRDHMQIDFLYDAALYVGTTVEAMLQQYQEILDHMTTGLDHRVT